MPIAFTVQPTVLSPPLSPHCASRRKFKSHPEPLEKKSGKVVKIHFYGLLKIRFRIEFIKMYTLFADWTLNIGTLSRGREVTVPGINFSNFCLSILPILFLVPFVLIFSCCLLPPPLFFPYMGGILLSS